MVLLTTWTNDDAKQIMPHDVIKTCYKKTLFLCYINRMQSLK